VSWCSRLRYLRLGINSLQLLASDEGALIGHPFLDPRFLGALARGDGKADRATFMTALFGELLPRAVLTRSTKASFDRAFFARHSRAFAANWDGAGADDGYVDVAQLRDDWTSSTPTPQTFTQLQSAWLAVSTGERGEEPLEPVGRSAGAHTASVLECG
jgi:asparagine synthase (glutamine-hydrolysing)